MVELMHGEISLESTLDSGTRATFSIPFNKSQFPSGAPLVDIGALPVHLQPDVSVSGCASDDRSMKSAPQSPLEGGILTQAGRLRLSGSHGSQTPPQAAEPETEEVQKIDRKHTHVLVVEDKYRTSLLLILFCTDPLLSAINQQIALKTIKKFGFSVSAVWNGQEALDYLAQEPSPAHPRPDIILMDVQMPILDGYRATHIIRHHNRYTSIPGLRTTPIVAMTASAIQGDREKCKIAGMDDYLAKPVKGKTLETMLLKWATASKRMAHRTKPYSLIDQNIHENDGSCTSDASDPSSSNFNAATNSSSDHVNNKTAVRDLESSSALSRIESEGDQGLKRAEAEEKARSLRDDKLLAASSTNNHFNGLPTSSTLHQAHSSASRAQPAAALTVANISQLDRAHDPTGITSFSPPLHIPASLAAGGAGGHHRGQSSGDHSSLAVGRDSDSETASTVGSLRNLPSGNGDASGNAIGGIRGWARRRLGRNDSDRSQVTVTQGNVGTSEGEGN
ncbi:MAG: hypothetical protein Q9198_003942 [Flavoplaca austrocitrina]